VGLTNPPRPGSIPVFDDDEPFSDEERVAAGMQPWQEPPPRETAGEQRKRLQTGYRAQQQELAGVRAKASPSSSGKSSGRSFGGGFLAKAGSGMGAVATGKWGGVSPAGLLLGFVAWAAALNLLEGGPDQLGKWMGAKWLNKQYTAPTTPASSATATIV
jgi:hypothetical protein